MLNLHDRTAIAVECVSKYTTSASVHAVNTIIARMNALDARSSIDNQNYDEWLYLVVELHCEVPKANLGWIYQ